MRIERNNALRMYENAKQTAKSDAAPLGIERDANSKTDRVSFSSDAAQKAPLGRMAQGVAADIETAAAGASRIAELTRAVNDGTYYVPTEKIVGAMIDVFG
ncbi:MAG: flagellar biosynthesis anti-sigma factor FlgM [Oscillospiraceae bacterium]|jgi:anti-sigma28 factor (negative regulator of flagellin synthesis)|nr:flagellar biosynthesis anti-sigma factor FlgM [Oscillospiraceae bacterium]